MKFSNRFKTGGYSLIELVFVMALVVIFGLTTFTLVVSGSEAYKSIMEKKNVHSELRIALSYINMRIRQGDREEGVFIKPSPVGNGSSIVIEEPIDEMVYETWIFWEDGTLREAFVEKGEAVSFDKSFEIARIDGFNADYYQGSKGISFEVRRIEKSIERRLNSLIFLRSSR